MGDDEGLGGEGEEGTFVCVCEEIEEKEGEEGKNGGRMMNRFVFFFIIGF